MCILGKTTVQKNKKWTSCPSQKKKKKKISCCYNFVLLESQISQAEKSIFQLDWCGNIITILWFWKCMILEHVIVTEYTLNR